jgi:acyl transferase domain-containing protein
MLPGIGDHYVGMAHELYEAYPIFKQEVDRCAGILKSHMDVDIRDIIYPKGDSWKQDSTTRGIDLKKMLGGKIDELENKDTRNLNQTQFAQPALFTIEYATARLWQSLGIRPDAFIGHSMGEYVAACLAGVFSLNDALQLNAKRAKLVSGLPQGTMLAVTLPENELLPMLPEDLSISLINGPSLCVVAGPIDAMAEFESKLNEKSILYRQVHNGHAFHSRMLDPIVKAFEREVSKVQLNEPTIPYISNVSGKWITANEATSSKYWALHATQTARFNDALQLLWQLDNPILLEAGPGRTLIALALQHPDRSSNPRPVTISSIRHQYENESDVEFLLRSVGNLWTSGIDIKWENLCHGDEHRIPLPTYPFERQHYWLEPICVPDGPSKSRVSIQKRPNTSEWLYVPSWKRLLPKGTGIGDSSLRGAKARKWLFFVDDYGFSSLLINRLKSAGHDVVTVSVGNSFYQANSHSFVIDPSNLQHYDSLIQALGINGTLPDRIVHVWSVTRQHSAESNADSFAQAQRLGFYSLLFLAKALATHNVGHEIQPVCAFG